ncbi:MAG: hypothetical protein HDT16_07140 [Oscillibacter sp.]|nr:hypothetical protein [Oscillibacter sp.]
MNKADDLRCAIIDRVAACTSERELDLIFRFANNLTEQAHPDSTRQRIVAMVGKIDGEDLLNRIYRFVKYIYIHVDGRAAQ